MSQEDISLDEKRIYGEKRETTIAYVASSLGLARVALSGDQVGRVGLVHQGPVADVAGGGGQLLVATPDDVLVGAGDEFAATGFGPAVAVGVDDGLLLAAGEGGEIGVLRGDSWESVGAVEAPHRFDGRYLAARDGVSRIADGSLEPLGLSDVRDVAAAGPYAVTDGALHRLTDGEWTVERAGAASVVAAAGDRAHLVADGGLHERVDDAWVASDLPVEEPVADVAYGESVYAVTRDGTVLVDARPETTPDGEGGWRHRSLGVPSVVSVAVP